MIVLMGANGNITSKAARLLLAKGRRVRVIGRDAVRMAPLKVAGAELSIGDALDSAFLTEAFEGAEAVYTMIPPVNSEPHFRAYQHAVGESTARAIVNARVRKVVALSSIGGSLAGGTGSVAGLHDQEERLNGLADVDVLHLRPAYFMENHLAVIPFIKAMNVYPGLIASDVPVAMIASNDIASVLAEEIAQMKFTGHSVKHLLGPSTYTMNQSAAILGAAADKPDLKYVRPDPAMIKAGLIQHGFSQDAADQIEELALALSDGRISATFNRLEATITPTNLESFAATSFAKAWRDSNA